MAKSIDIINGAQHFESATLRAFWQEIIGHLRGKPAQLLSFEDVRTRLRLREESYQGLHNIPLSDIVGSVGRYQDFTSTFLPKAAVSRDRWTRIYAETVGEMGLPPIEVYRVCELFFVRDGNHRVSVARALGFKTIQAYVTNVDVPVCLNRLMITRNMDAAEAYIAFLDETGLRYTRPNHESLMLSEPSRYNDLIGHLNVHAAVLAGVGAKPDMETAAAHWYDHVYAPAVALMRQYGVLDTAKGRTEADLYLWMVDHLCELEVCYTGDVHNFDPALVAFLQKRNLPVPRELAVSVEQAACVSLPEHGFIP